MGQHIYRGIRMKEPLSLNSIGGGRVRVVLGLLAACAGFGAGATATARAAGAGLVARAAVIAATIITLLGLILVLVLLCRTILLAPLVGHGNDLLGGRILGLVLQAAGQGLSVFARLIGLGAQGLLHGC